MEASVSISNPTFQAGEDLAQRLGLSRSELYTLALQAFISMYNKEHITDALNQVYDRHKSTLDPVVTQMQFRSLPYEDW